MTRQVALIPARGGSKRIPNKNIKSLGGRPLIEYSIMHALRAEIFDEIVVSTEDHQIAEIAKNCGANVPFFRPDELAGDEVGSFAVLNHFIENFWLHDVDYIICLLQPTSPLRNVLDINAMMLRLQTDQQLSSIVSTCGVPHQYSIESQFEVDENWIIRGDGPEILLRSQDKTVRFARNGPSILGTKKSTIRAGSIYGERCQAYMMEGYYNLDIDTLADFNMAEVIMRGLDSD